MALRLDTLTFLGWYVARYKNQKLIWFNFTVLKVNVTEIEQNTNIDKMKHLLICVAVIY